MARQWAHYDSYAYGPCRVASLLWNSWHVTSRRRHFTVTTYVGVPKCPICLLPYFNRGSQKMLAQAVTLQTSIPKVSVYSFGRDTILTNVGICRSFQYYVTQAKAPDLCPGYVCFSRLYNIYYHVAIRSRYSDGLDESGSNPDSIQTGSGVHPTSYPNGYRGLFPGGKAVGAWSWPLTSN
jgi:hypothetical protein